MVIDTLYKPHKLRYYQWCDRECQGFKFHWNSLRGSWNNCSLTHGGLPPPWNQNQTSRLGFVAFNLLKCLWRCTRWVFSPRLLDLNSSYNRRTSPWLRISLVWETTYPTFYSQHAGTCKHLIPTDVLLCPKLILSMRIKKSQRLSFVFTCVGGCARRITQPAKLKMDPTSTIEDSPLRLRRKPTATIIPNKREMTLPLNAWKTFGLSRISPLSSISETIPAVSTIALSLIQ